MDKKEINPKLGYSRPSSQPKLGPVPLASFEDLMTDELVSEASLIEDLPCMSECLDDRMFHETNNGLNNKRKLFERCDTWNSADLNGSLISLTPTCSITPTELSSPTKTLTPVQPITPVTPVNLPIKSIFNPNNRQYINQYSSNQLNIQHGNPYNNQIINHFTNQNPFINQNQLQLNRGRDSKNKKQSNEALKVPLSPSITLNDIQNLNDSEFSNHNKPRKNSWTNFFRSRSKSTGNASSGRSRTPSFISFFSPKQSTNQLNKTPSTKSKKRRMSNLFSFFKKPTRSSLQDLSNKENKFNANLLSTNLDRLQSSSSPKVLNCESNYNLNNLTTNHKNDELNLNNNQHCKTSTNDYIEEVVNNQIKLEKVVENNSITLRKTFNSKESVNEFVTKIELIMKEKDKEFDKKIKEDIYLEEKILDDLPIEELERKMNFKSPNNVNELDKKDVLLKRSLKNKRSDTLDEIRSLPERLPSFRRKQQQQQSNNDSSINQDLDTNSESDDQTTTITDQLSSKKSNYVKKNADKIEIENLLEDEDTYNELLYKNELVNSPSNLKLLDKNERLNIKIIPIERPRSVTPVNFASFETFFNSSNSNKEIDEQEKIKLKLPELPFSEIQNRKVSPRKSSPQIFLEFCQKGLQTPRHHNLDDQITDQYSVEEAFSSIVNSSTNETISEYLIENEELNDNELNRKENAFEDDFVNDCLADLAQHVISQSIQIEESNDKQVKDEICFEANFELMNQNITNSNEKLDINNNLIQNCDNCEKCKLNQLNENLECKCDCHFDNEYSSKNTTISTTKKPINKNLRRYSISSSDISSTASSRLIYSSTSSSSNSSRRHSLSANISNERLEL